VRERAERTLALVLETTGAPGGHLYSLQHGKVVRVASAGARPPQDALTDAIANYLTRFDQINEEHTAVVSAENDLEHGGAALLTVEGSGYRLFPLSNPQAVERTLGVLALARHEQERAELINEVLAAISYELSMHSELSLFTLATSV
jgi:hypothetical protein